MNTMTSPRAFRGVTALRAETDPTKLLNDLHKAVSDMRAENDSRLKALEKGRDDVVTTDKVERINAAISGIEAALAQNNERLAHLDLSGGRSRVPDAEYSKAFAAHIRKGDVQASLNKGTASEGGYLAPTEWDRTIIDRLVLLSPMRQVCMVQPISTNGFSKVFNSRGTASGWVGETTARTETTAAAFGTLTYATGEIYANPSATQQLLDDAAVDLESWLAGEVETEFAYQEGIAFLSGNGTNRPNGILTYVTGGANAAAHPWGAVAVVNSGHASTLTADGIVNLVHALPSAYTGNARFAMNRSTQKAVRLLKDGQGNYLWQPSYAAGQPATLAGYPVTEMPGMPDIAASAKPILFGDFRRSYLIVDRTGVRVVRDPYSNKPYVQFYSTKRVGGGLLDPDSMKAQNVAA